MEGKKLRKIAIYGKGGIGKSTTSSNLSAALSHLGEKVFQVGCDPKRDSIATLCGQLMPTILERTRDSVRVVQEMVDEVIFTGYNGVKGCECGGPAPGTGCAGKGVDLALKLLDKFNVYERYGATFVLYDVLGDVVCGGFAQPMKDGYAQEIYIVTCGELLTLYQINIILSAVAKLHKAGADVGVAGIINNMRGVPHEREIVEDFASLIGVPVIQHVPRSKTVQEAELLGKTVVEAFPDSPQAAVYRSLAEKVVQNKDIYVPTPTNMKQLKELVRRYQVADDVPGVGLSPRELPA